ncbi:hypothetical protein [Gymnodinialimonas hymeniacidonis]|uniref:hypothetical protein n=1 Tax=Gymnodinialimonas hymeniacidonis TaxID=3126508 RepID=UPI0034C64B2A
MTTLRPQKDAKAIYQDVLDTMDAHIENGAFDAFAARIILPYRVQTHETTHHVEDRSQLRAGFDDMRHRMTLRNIARRSRHCASATFKDATTIEGHHITWLVTDDHTIVESYQVSNTLACSDGLWCIAGNGYSGEPDRLPLHMIEAMTRLAQQSD